MILSSKIDPSTNQLTLVIQLNPQPPASKTGKTLMASTTSGFVALGQSLNGKPLKASINIIIPKA